MSENVLEMRDITKSFWSKCLKKYAVDCEKRSGSHPSWRKRSRKINTY